MGKKQRDTKGYKFNPNLQLLNGHFLRKMAHCFL